MDNYTLVRNAIVAKQIVTGMYHDHHREMCPHVIGLRGGRRQALFYQFAGSSASGLPPDGEWRCLQVDELKVDFPRFCGHRVKPHSVVHTPLG